MPVSGISHISSQNTAAATGLNGFTPDDFMNLLVTELRMQDPMSPMDTQAVVQQLSQMQMVAETRQTREYQEFSQALGLIGHTVQWQDTQTGATGSGQVTGVIREGSSARVVVAGQHLALDQINAVS